VVDDEFVAVSDVALDTGAGHRSQEFLDKADRSGEGGGSDVGAEPGVVENHLLRRIDGGVRVIPGNPVHLVDVRYPLLRTCAAVLTRPVGVDDDVLWHFSLHFCYGSTIVGSLLLSRCAVSWRRPAVLHDFSKSSGHERERSKVGIVT
jgi:hypothetical protein